MGVIALGVLVLIDHKQLRIFKAYLKNPLALTITAFFFIHLLSGLWSEDLDYWVGRSRVKLPFLVLPIALIATLPFNNFKRLSIYYVFILNLLVISMVIMFDALSSADGLSGLYSRGQTISTPIPHIRFSLLTAFASILAFHLADSGQVIRYKWERWVMLVAGLGLAIFIHVLAVRSGLICFYLVAGLLVMVRMFSMKRKVFGIIFLGMIILAPILSYQFLDSFKAKVDYFRFSMEMYYKNTDPHNYSDSRRIISIKAGIDLVKANPFLGVGAGDLLNEMEAIYHRKYREMENHFETDLIHNQYVYTWAATGIIGFLILLVLLFWPLIISVKRKNAILFAVIAFHIISIFVEHSLERQISVCFLLLFMTIELNQMGFLNYDKD